MLSIYRGLLWKEFHEHKWVAIAAAAVVLAVPLAQVSYDYEMALDRLKLALIWYPLIAGAFFGARAAAGERANHTAMFIAAIPVPSPVVGQVRIFVVILAALIPLALLEIIGALLGKQLVAGTSLRAEGTWSLAASSALFTVFWTLVVAVLGMGQPTEVRAAIRGLLAVTAIAALGFPALIIVMNLLSYWQLTGEPEPMAHGEVQQAMALRLAVAVVTLGLAVAFVMRYDYALLDEPRRSRSVWPPLGTRLLSALSRVLSAFERLLEDISELHWEQWTALVGKSVRETWFGGLQIMVVTALILIAIYSGVLPEVAVPAGCIFAVLLGVGAFAPDLEPRINTFWRSRPIRANQWFWSKYVVGLAPFLLVAGVSFITRLGPHSLIEQLVGIAFWMAIYSTAVAATCLVRKPIYAAILTLGVFSFVLALTGVIFSDAGPPAATVLAICLLTILASMSVGWWAGVNDVAVS